MFGKKNLMEELTDYIKKNLRKGYTKESLRWALIDQGYSKLEVDRAFTKVDRQLSQSAPILKTKPEIEHKIISPIQEEKKPFWKKFF